MKRSSFKRLTVEDALKKARTKVKKASKKKAKPATITQLKKLLWTEIKRIIRARYGSDGRYICFTCGRNVDIPHTGHIITSSLCSAEMRYSLDNLRLQCYACNIHLSGNWVSFLDKLGVVYVEDLIKRNTLSKGKSFHTDWYLKKIEEYRSIKS